MTAIPIGHVRDLMDYTIWLVALALPPLVVGFMLMLLPEALWRGLAGDMDQANSAIGAMAVGLIALGIAVTALYGQFLWDGWRSQRWQAVHGVVMESGLARVMSPRSTLSYWEPRLRYTYTVEGMTVEGTRLSFQWEKTPDRDALETQLKREWLPGEAVTVWVDPADPVQSVLKPGTSGWLTLFVGTGLVLLGVGVHLLRLALQPGAEMPAKREIRHKAVRPKGPAPVVASKRRKGRHS